MGDPVGLESKKWSVVYPVFINSRKKIPEGRRVSKAKGVDNPTAQEIYEVCKHLGFRCELEVKAPSRSSSLSNAAHPLPFRFCLNEWLIIFFFFFFLSASRRRHTLGTPSRRDACGYSSKATGRLYNLRYTAVPSLASPSCTPTEKLTHSSISFWDR